MLLPSGNPFECHEEVLYFQLLIPPKRFDIFSPRLGEAQKVWVHLDFKKLTLSDHERDWPPCKVVFSGWQPIR